MTSRCAPVLRRRVRKDLVRRRILGPAVMANLSRYIELQIAQFRDLPEDTRAPIRAGLRRFHPTIDFS